MTVAKMFFWCKPFEVIGAIIGFVAVDVMHVFRTVWVVYPTSGDDAVHQSPAAKRKVSIIPLWWDIRRKFSKDFSTPRNGIEVVEETIFGSVYFNANHGDTFMGSGELILRQI